MGRALILSTSFFSFSFKYARKTGSLFRRVMDGTKLVESKHIANLVEPTSSLFFTLLLGPEYVDLTRGEMGTVDRRSGKQLIENL